MDRRGEINCSFVEDKIVVTKIRVYEETLEDYFKKQVKKEEESIV